MNVRAQHGFTLIEVLVAIVVLAIGVLAAFTALDSSRRLSLISERQTTMAHRAQSEIESLKALPYAELGLSGTSSSWSANPSDPNGVNLPPGSCPGGSTVPTYQPDHSAHPSTTTEPLIINGCSYTVSNQTNTYTGGVVMPYQTWSNGTFSGSIYDFVTYASDPNCSGTNCPTTNNYKRLTVVVTLNGATAPSHPTIVSTYVSDPNLNSQYNLPNSPSTQCTLGSTTGSCSQTVPGTPVPITLCDASYSSGCNPSGPSCSGNTLDNTLVSFLKNLLTLAPAPDATSSSLPTGDCSSSSTTTSTSTTSSSSSTTTTTTTSTGPPVVPCYATDLLSNCQGLPIYPSGNPTCGNAPPLDNSKAHSWLGSAIPTGSSMTLTGAGAMTTYLEATSGVSVNATLCLRLYVVPNLNLGLLGTNLLSTPISTTISTNVTAQAGVISPVTFNFPSTAITAGTSVAATTGPVRIEFVVWLAGSTQPVQLIYDQANFASTITLMRQ